MQSNALPSPEQLEGELEHSKEKIEMLERELHIKDELLDAKIILEEKVQSEKDTRLVNIEMQLEELQHVVQDSSEMVLRTITREEKIADAKVDINVSSVGSQTEALEMELAIAQIPPPAPETTIVPISGLHTAQSSVFSKLESIDLFGEVVAQVRQIIGADRVAVYR